jgi:hypothetical protein
MVIVDTIVSLDGYAAVPTGASIGFSSCATSWRPPAGQN